MTKHLLCYLLIVSLIKVGMINISDCYIYIYVVTSSQLRASGRG